MAIQEFVLNRDGKDVHVLVTWSRWSYDGDVKVDGKVAVRWIKGKWVPRRVEFKIGNEDAAIVRTGWLIEKWDLLVGEQKIGAKS